MLRYLGRQIPSVSGRPGSQRRSDVGRIRVADRTRETRKHGSTERHTDWTYDDFGRVGTVEAPVSGTTSYTYGFSGGLPFTSVENELGIVRETLRNQLGHPIREKVTAWGGATPAGAGEVRYSYADGSGCGCARESHPYLVATYDTSTTPQVMTEVTREYSPRGEVTEEEITVHRGGGSVAQTTGFSFGADGEKTGIDYPVRPGSSSRSRVEYDRRSSGLVTALRVKDATIGAFRTVGLYEYDGRREIARTMRDFAASPAIVAQVEQTIDPLGYPAQKTYEVAAGFQSGPFTDAVEERTIDGFIRVRVQPPRLANASQLYSAFAYAGAGWLARQSWDLEDPEEIAGSGHDQEYDLNGFGEIEKNTDSDRAMDPCGPSYPPGPGVYSAEITYGRTPAGQLQTMLEPQARLFYAPDNGNNYIAEDWLARSFVYNTAGWLVTSGAEYRKVTTCARCDGTPGTVDRSRKSEHFEHSTEQVHDAWGRSVASTFVKVLEEGSYGWTLCSLTPEGSTADETLVDRTDETIYDGYGRAVYTLRPVKAEEQAQIGLYHAYDGHAIIMSQDSGTHELGAYASHLERYRNPTSGTADKLHYYRDPYGTANAPGATPWGSATGNGFMTPLHDVFGRVSLANGTYGSGMTPLTGPPFYLEGAYPGYTRLYLASGEETWPYENVEGVGDVLAWEDPMQGPGVPKAEPKLVPGGPRSGVSSMIISIPTCGVDDEHWTHKLVAKSYIADPVKNWNLSSHQLRQLTDIFSENPKTDAPDTNDFRLFSGVKYFAFCKGDELGMHFKEAGTGAGNGKHEGDFVDSDDIVDFKPFVTYANGRELMMPGTGEVSEASVKRIDQSSIKFSWKFRGRPNSVTEPGIRALGGTGAVNPRARLIWHTTDFTFTCKGYVEPMIEGFSANGSEFPSHRVWIRGTEAWNKMQGDVDWLVTPGTATNDEVP